LTHKEELVSSESAFEQLEELAAKYNAQGFILRLSSCRSTKGFIIPSLPHLAAERLKLSMAPLLHPHYQTSSLLRATPPSWMPSAPFPCRL
jgi:hypothetical protein